MKQLRYLVGILITISTLSVVADSTTAVLPLITMRSQSNNNARELVGMINHINTYEPEKNYIAAYLAPEYTHSLNHTELTQSLFGCFYLHDEDVLKITGTTIDSGQSSNLAAHWLYLPNNYRGSICFKPVIQNITVDMNLHWSMDTWVRGLFVRLQAPLVGTKWDLNANFTTVETDIEPQNGVQLLQTAEDYFCGGKAAAADNASYHPLSCSRFCSYTCHDNKTQAGLADIRLDGGWNFLQHEDYSLGSFIRVVAPTSNKPKGIWLFEPIVGNGHHWELGAGMLSNTLLWHNAEATKGISLTIEASATHLFGSQQQRVFDLKGKPLSRYMYAQKEGELTFSPLANLTSCAVNVSFGAQASLVALLNYSHYNWSFDLGYNLWTRSCETIGTCSPKNCSTSSCDTCGSCVLQQGNREHWYLQFSDASIGYIGSQPNTTPLSSAEIDYEGARARSTSQKVFTHLDYCWSHHATAPHVGIGGELEFGHCKKEPPTSTVCTTFKRSIAVSQGGLWLKVGATF